MPPELLGCLTSRKANGMPLIKIFISGRNDPSSVPSFTLNGSSSTTVKLLLR